MGTTNGEGGFAIGTYSEDLIQENACEHFDPKREVERHGEMLAAGMIEADATITPKGWEVLNADVLTLERNALAWMRRKFVSAVDHGHDEFGDLVGAFSFELGDVAQAELVDLASKRGRSERIDMSDRSFGDLCETVWTGVSDFGAAILGGAITFDVDEETGDEVDGTLYWAGQRAKAAQPAGLTGIAGDVIDKAARR